MKKIFFITSYFPPVNTSASIRALNYANYLTHLGNEVHVLTLDYPEDFVNFDKTLGERVDKRVQVHRIKFGPYYSKIYPTKESGYKTESKEKVRRFLFLSSVKRQIKSLFAIPDSYVEWVARSRNIAPKIIRDNKIEYIISMHESPSSHLIGLYLKNKFPYLKWITYWSDPWTLDMNRRSLPYIRRKIEKGMERKVIQKADKYLFTTKQTLEMYMKQYDIKPDLVDIVYRGYEPINKSSLTFEKNELLVPDKINLVHTGEIFSSYRDMTPFIKALEKLKLTNPKIYNMVNIVLIGGIDDLNISHKVREMECFSHSPRLSYEESLVYMTKADFLLLWGNKFGNQIPGKVYEYFGCNVPIISILANKEDPLIELMQKVNKGPLVLNESERILDILQTLFTKKNLDQSWYRCVDEYRWENVVDDLLKKITK